METRISLQAIGIIHSPHTVPEQTPIQPIYATEFRGQVEVFPQFAEGLQDIEGYSHIYLLYALHRAGPVRLRVRPFLQDVERGVFATRAPCRPNGIGMSIVSLLRREGRILHVGGVDMLDGTPLLDIKPYSHRFDCLEGTRNGWQDEVAEPDARLRGRRNCPPAARAGQGERN
ncbi:tRNA (N6-threonylcarbamoyladenosine(37)-N6)-methyltransferase TrmO [uncultured Desulfovibrio sp.]|uniref:tRNA (N6-threonylcarbamoyladenosine(37)-N6)-methyltransferase TrmO n=1 Tax=uncultured Desulfovibrio sp. TaxID=167968 RepID=UPI002616684E|nr:tRNA (N6-threonylcarbamoyladenosine(37)-N6)-methyltransferase TrmO [uncultured Desulfovibrio sp.]